MNNILIKFRRKYSAQRFAGILLMFFAFNSCNFLNINDYIDEQLKYDSIFASKRYIEAYMWDAANKFPNEGSILGGSNPDTPGDNMYTPGPMATDEAFCLFSTGEFQGMAYVLGEYSADNFGFLNRWQSYYQIIRQCNIIFARIDEATDWDTNKERSDILAYTRFIRAYAYYNLIVNWGPVVILYDEVPGNNEEIEYYDRPRDLYDDCMEYVCGEFELAAETLPEEVPSIMNFGHPTRGAALALVARLRLMHASPLFNGGQIARTYYGSWTRKTDGKNYIAQTPDPKRWAVAAAAAKRVMDLTIRGRQAYALYTVERDEFTPPLPTNVDDPDYHNTFPEGAEGIDPYRSYSEMFNGEAVAYVNQEYIWTRSSRTLLNYTRHSFPLAYGGYNGMGVTQKIVDAYAMADGRTITSSSEEYPYSETGFTEEETSFSGYKLNEGVNNMYNNREMRFYASIGFSECFWPCSSTSDNSSKNITVTYYNDSPNGRASAAQTPNYPITGYVIKKFIHPNDAWYGTNARLVSKSFPIIRYAEILLSYAEALNALEGNSYTIETNGTSQTFTRDVNEIKKAINQVRYRAGLPGLTDAELADADYVLSKIKTERMIEFLYENRRYFDVRRWGDYEDSEMQAIMGMNTSANKDSYYQRVVVANPRVGNRVVNRKMIFLPIPRQEIKRLPSFDQNPGW
jgi:hypothetical protein